MAPASHLTIKINTIDSIDVVLLRFWSPDFERRVQKNGNAQYLRPIVGQDFRASAKRAE